MISFLPDLIVEVTSTCDRKCAGCYAPNVISKENATTLFESSPELFLNPNTLERALSSIHGAEIQSIAIRGGEPSRHPLLLDLARISRCYSESVFIETHARWIQDAGAIALLESLKSLNVTLKISFDQMHGLSPFVLKTLTSKLEEVGIRFVIAITEFTTDAFSKTRQLCAWLKDEQIIFQRKAVSVSELVRPRLGVIRVDGSLSGQLTAQLSGEAATA